MWDGERVERNGWREAGAGWKGEGREDGGEGRGREGSVARLRGRREGFGGIGCGKRR